jgi:hypothetical protein
MQSWHAKNLLAPETATSWTLHTLVHLRLCCNGRNGAAGLH